MISAYLRAGGDVDSIQSNFSAILFSHISSQDLLDWGGRSGQLDQDRLLKYLLSLSWKKNDL